MPQKQWSHSEAFAFFDAKGNNPRWSWSARSSDGKVIVLTLWQDELKPEGKKWVYHAKARGDFAEWLQKPGNKEKLENLKWAQDECDGLFRVVVAIEQDTSAIPRAIKECFPHPKLIMRITELDRETGEFRAISQE